MEKELKILAVKYELLQEISRHKEKIQEVKKAKAEAAYSGFVKSKTGDSTDLKATHVLTGQQSDLIRDALYQSSQTDFYPEEAKDEYLQMKIKQEILKKL